MVSKRLDARHNGQNDSHTQMRYIMSKNIDKNKKQKYNTPADETDLVFEEEESENNSLKKLRAKLKQCVSGKQEYLDGWQRTKAEFINARKQDEKHLESNKARIVENFVLSLVPVLDSFDLALSDKNDKKDIKGDWYRGVENIQTQLMQILSEYNVKSLNPIGEQFDPAYHETIAVTETKDKQEDGLIEAVLQKGYVCNKNVIRAAKVSVKQYKNN